MVIDEPSKSEDVEVIGSLESRPKVVNSKVNHSNVNFRLSSF
jgi:hypothetical protein